MTTKRHVRLGAAIAVGTAMALGVLPAQAKTSRPAAPVDTTGQLQESGQVTHVSDGDTIFVKTPSQGPHKVRMLGVQAMEVGQCGAQEAEDLLNSLIPEGSKVQLFSLQKGSTGRDNRDLRYVMGKNDNGGFNVDAQEALLRSGLATFFGHVGEAARSRHYFALAEQARLNGVGLWSGNMCGIGPEAATQIEMVVNWDAPKNDAANVNGEYVLIRNTGSTPVNLKGWRLRDSSLDMYHFRFPDLTVQPGSLVQVSVGTGSNSNSRFFYGSRSPRFPNTTKGPTFVADGAYLVDTLGNLRSSFTYPCVIRCTDPLQTALRITKVVSNPKTHRAVDETVTIRNLSGTDAYLGDVYLRRKISTYTFPPSTTVPAGGKITVHIGKGTNTGSHVYMGYSARLLGNSDRVELLTLRDIPIDCKAWGGASCPG